MEPLVCEAICEAAQMCAELGALVRVVVRKEAQTGRDDFRSIKQLQESGATVLSVCAMNIEYGPSSRTLERAGLRDDAEVSIWTPAKQWQDAGIEYRDIDLERTTVELSGERWMLREKSRAVVIQGTAVFYTFGLTRTR